MRKFQGYTLVNLDICESLDSTSVIAGISIHFIPKLWILNQNFIHFHSNCG